MEIRSNALTTQFKREKSNDGIFTFVLKLPCGNTSANGSDDQTDDVLHIVVVTNTDLV